MNAELTPPLNTTANTQPRQAISAFLQPGLISHPRASAYLESHGFSALEAAGLGWYECAPEHARRLGALHPQQIDGADCALVMPCYNADGTLDQEYNRFILFPRDEHFIEPDGTQRPYRKLSPSAKKAANRAMFLPGVDYEHATSILLCESLPKAAYVWLRYRAAAIGLNGVSGWSEQDFEALPKNAEYIFVSDSLKPKSKRDIEAAAQRLAAILPGLKWTYPPPPPASHRKEDWGVDDAGQHAGDAKQYVFRLMLDAARPVKSPGDSSPITITPAFEILKRPPTAWVVKDLIPANELIAIVGPTNCGKTFLTMDLLLAVARGEQRWFGKRIRRYGSVVHVTLEGGGLRNRLTAYMQHHKLDALSGYHAIETPINLRLPEQAEAIIAAVAALPHAPAVIAIDTVNRALGGGDENSSTDMGALLANAECIKAAFPNSAVLLVHHLGKDASKGARGHSSLSCNVGAELHVVNDDATGIRTVTVEKQRDGTTDFRFNFKLGVVDLGRDEDHEEITSCVVEPSTAPVNNADASEDEIYRWIYSYNSTELGGAPISKAKVKEHATRMRPHDKKKVTKEDVKDAFLGAITKGYAIQVDGAKNGDLYRLLPPRERKF